MAGGFADVNPVDMARVFLAADDQRYKRGVEMADRQNKFLDEEAIRIQSTWDQVAQELADGVNKLAIAASQDGSGITADELLQNPQWTKWAQDQYVNQNFDRLAPVLNGIVQSPLVNDEFKRAFGAHRDLRGISTVDDATGNRMFGVRVRNEKTGTEGVLDSSPDGTDTSKGGSAPLRLMSGADLMNNLAGLSDVAVLRRGGFTTGARHIAGNTAAEASNRALEESRAGLREQNRLAAEGASQISADASKVHLLGTDAVTTTPASPSGSVSVSGSGSGAAVVPPQPLMPPPATPPAKPPTATKNTGAGLNLVDGSVVDDVGKGAWNAVGWLAKQGVDAAKAASEAEDKVRGHARELNPARMANQIARSVNINNALRDGKPVRRGDIEYFAHVDGVTEDFAVSRAEAVGIKDERVLNELRAMYRAYHGREDSTTKKTAVDRSIAIGDKLAADTPLPPAVAGTVSAYQTGNATPEETAKVLSRTFNGKISAGAIEKVLNAATDTRLLGAKQAKWTLNEARAIGLLQRYGVITPEQAAGMRTPAKAVAEAQAKDIENVTNQAFAAKAPQVDTSIARTAMDNAAADQRTRMTLTAQIGKERTDKFLDNEEKSLKELFTQQEKDSGVEQKVRYLYRNTAPFAIAAGYDLAGSQTDASQYGQQMKQFYARLNATNPGLIRRFFGAQGVDFLNSSGAKFINAVAPEAIRTPQAVAEALPKFRAAAQNGGLSSDAAAALSRGNEGEAFRLWAQDEAIRDLEATLGE